MQSAEARHFMQNVLLDESHHHEGAREAEEGDGREGVHDGHEFEHVQHHRHPVEEHDHGLEPAPAVLQVGVLTLEKKLINKSCRIKNVC